MVQLYALDSGEFISLENTCATNLWATWKVHFAYIDQLKSLDGERPRVPLRNALFCDIVGGIEVGGFDIETDAIGSHAGEYVIDLVAQDLGARSVM